jgi:hypothetical protein
MNPTVIPTYGQIVRSIRTLKDFEKEHTLLPESFAGNVERLARVYAAAKPLLTALALTPFLPRVFRDAVALLDRAIAAVIAGAGEIRARFKAGRDL